MPSKSTDNKETNSSDSSLPTADESEWDDGATGFSESTGQDESPVSTTQPQPSTLENNEEADSNAGRCLQRTSSGKITVSSVSADLSSFSCSDGKIHAESQTDKNPHNKEEGQVPLAVRRSTRTTILSNFEFEEESNAENYEDLEAGAFPFGGVSPTHDVDDGGTIQYSAIELPRSNDEECAHSEQESDSEDDSEKLVIAELAPETVLGTALPMQRRSQSQQPRGTITATQARILIGSLVAIALAFVLYILLSRGGNTTTQQSNEESFSLPASPAPAFSEVIQTLEPSPLFPPSSIPTGSPAKWSSSPPKPTRKPATAKPTSYPSLDPSWAPSNEPSDSPSATPTSAPPTRNPTTAPTKQPTLAPTTKIPTPLPTTQVPTQHPTKHPTPFPTTESPTEKPSNRPTTSTAPTLAPTTSPSDSQAPTSVLQILSAQFPNLPSSEHQRRALDWLFSDDGALALQDPSDSIHERFVMAVFFFATHGENWGSSDRWLSRLSVCDWNGLTCIGGSVVEINLPALNLNGTIPTEIEQLTDLTWLVLERNDLDGSLPSGLGRMRSLTLMNLCCNSLTGTIPTEVGLLTGLRQLELDQNALTGTIPTELGRLTSMVDLDLCGNAFTGAIPTELGKLTRMVELEMQSNLLSGTIPTELGRLTESTELRLFGNLLNGTIPTEFGQLTRLQLFGLHYNALTGTLPTEFGKLAESFELLLYGNMLTGTIPTEYGLLNNVRLFELDGNVLSGTIPTELGLLGFVEDFDLFGNLLTGTIPTELGQLTNAVEFELQRNDLTGTIPSELALLTALTELKLGGNNLSGRVPTELDNLLDGLMICSLGGNADLRDVPSNCE